MKALDQELKKEKPWPAGIDGAYFNHRREFVLTDASSADEIPQLFSNLTWYMYDIYIDEYSCQSLSTGFPFFTQY